MAFMMACEKVEIEFATKRVFDCLTVGVNDGDRIGIVGKNGDGKSTLLKLFMREVEPDEGRVQQRGNLHLGYLGQGDHLSDADTVEHAVVGDTPEYIWASDARIREILASLLSDVDWHARVGELSGGQRRRVDLARLLIGDWDALLLDEPTNHLDVKAITWLAGHLKTRWRDGEGALLVVTHDRWFLDEVCLDMWEVHNARLTPFEGGFSAYIQQRVERDRVAQVREQRRQSVLRKELAWLSRGARARSTKPKFHVAAAQALIAEDPPVRDTLELKRLSMQRLGKQVVDLVNVTAGYEGKTILRDVEWIIGPGERIGIVGANGAGKTTLLNVITQQMAPQRGYVKVGKSVKFAVLSQRLKELEPVEDDYVRVVLGRIKQRYVVDGKEVSPGQLLERMGFERQQLNSRVMDLSGGQRRRLQLLLTLLAEPNVLILDEPGNDMDTDMLAVMEDLLDAWPGTLILVTHDRYLMERVTDDQYALIDCGIRHLPGGVDEYLDIVRERETHAASSDGQKPAVTPEAATPSTGLSNKELHQARKDMASLERKLATAEKALEQAKADQLAIDPTDYEALVAGQKAVDEAQERKDDLELQWLELAELVGE
ncbi:MAG: ABC-F family ATP-binding cassette domain-containing protein [Coriobacteriaceae bacterium]|nr:ABC-F family ATP-binding cassette domain-containing protein [Coriobacteriaceae bacterium]MDO4890300.1 ABC-F family ATP-binding cassette domain-containing protein [Coriobacteriaceae bacterium]